MIVFAALYTALFFAQVEEPYAWPLEQPRALTSSFAEYRGDRFHMGIDLRTGPIGKKVFAAGNGHISRIRCSPYGYGKAVYIQLDDGHIAIYAHLNSFTPELNQYVQKAQHTRTSYTVDLYPKANAFPIKKSQQIGYSGQTGIGVPHLHWELRDYSGVPINPRLLGISWPDSTPPRFRNILLIPTTPDTTINGDYLPVVLPVKHLASGQYQATSAKVHGSVALGVDVYDPANQGASKLGVHRITTQANELPVFDMAHDRVSYSHAGDGVVAYHPQYRDKGKFLMQWPWPGIKTEMYAKSSGSGEIKVNNETQIVQVDAVDFFDQQSTIQFRLEPQLNYIASTSDDPSVDKGKGTIFYNSVRDWLVISVQFSTPESITPLFLESGIISTDTLFHRINATTFRAVFQSNSNVTSAGISIEHPRAGHDPDTKHLWEHHFAIADSKNQALDTTLGTIGLKIEPNDLFERLYITGGVAPAIASKELQPLGDAFILWPENAPLRSAIGLNLPLPHSFAGNIGIYRKKGDDWQWVSSKQEKGRLTFSTRKLGTYQIMQDTVKPSIRLIRPSGSSPLSSQVPDIRIKIKDEGSGIAKWHVTFRNEWILMAYDPEENELVWERDKTLTTGPGQLVIQVYDEAGNVSTQTLDLSIP